jgi:hypothetical protein
MVLIKNAAFVASFRTNAFHFHHYEMLNLVLYVNGVQQHLEPITVDCSSPFGPTKLSKHDFEVLVFFTMIVLILLH